MLKKIILSFILLSFVSFGLLLIAVLSLRLKSARKGVFPPSDTSFVVGEQEKEVVGIREVFDFDKPNDIIASKIGPTKIPIIEKVKIEEPGFVVIYQDSDLESKDVLGFSQLLSEGESTNVPVFLKRALYEGETVYLGLRLDDGDKYFEFTGRYDKNVSRADGTPILWKIEVKN